MDHRLIVDPLSFDARERSPAPFLIFTLYVLAHLLAFYIFVRVISPNIWNSQIHAGVTVIIATFIVCHFMFAFGEYLFHRYILHILTYEAMGVFYRKHLQHHALTPIQLDEPRQKINNLYPIKSIEQDVCGTFPPWALLVFLGGFTPILFLIAYVFPNLPILISGYPALSLSYYLYEVIHVRHHSSYETWWQEKLKSPKLGRLWQAMYGFHQAHHANYRCNMHVGGFFGIPIGDWLFATYKQPSTLLMDGVPATKEMIQELNPKPRWPISWFDKIAIRRKMRTLNET